MGMRYIFTFFMALFFCLPAMAQSPAENNAVIKAENYLRNLDTLAARFTQVDNYGGKLTGQFYLDRPGRLRFEYDQSDDFIVADGLFIYFYDSELGEQSNAPVGQTLADFLLREDLRFDGEVAVTDVWKDNGFTHITLVQRADPAAGNLRLVFQDEPYLLRMWRVVDAQGYITKVYLDDVRSGVELPRGMFAYIDPEKDEPHYNE